MRWRDFVSIILVAIAFGILMWIFSFAPAVELTAKEFVLGNFREVIWQEYGILIVLISMITSVVLIVSVFAIRISEIAEVGGGEG